MIESGQVDTFQQLAEIGRISHPRMTQIMSLLNLAPDIQEELLYLPEVMQGKATIHERLLRPHHVPVLGQFRFGLPNVQRRATTE